MAPRASTDDLATWSLDGLILDFRPTPSMNVHIALQSVCFSTILHVTLLTSIDIVMINSLDWSQPIVARGLVMVRLKKELSSFNEGHFSLSPLSCFKTPFTLVSHISLHTYIHLEQLVHSLFTGSKGWYHFLPKDIYPPSTITLPFSSPYPIFCP